MEENKNGILFETEDGEQIMFYVLARTSLAGRDYLLVTDSGDEEAEAYILEKTAADGDEETDAYEMVEDDTELDALSKVFAEELDDIELTI